MVGLSACERRSSVCVLARVRVRAVFVCGGEREW